MKSSLNHQRSDAANPVHDGAACLHPDLLCHHQNDAAQALVDTACGRLQNAERSLMADPPLQGLDVREHVVLLHARWEWMKPLAWQQLELS